MTGLSGSGKTTLAQVMRRVHNKMVVLDGDVMRSGLCKGLGFSMEDRRENIRRAAEVCKIINDQGIDVVAAFIAPTESIRKLVKDITNAKIVYIKCSLEQCVMRDPKGLYKDRYTVMTGIGSAYEEPIKPDLVLDTEYNSVMDCGSELIKYYNKVRGD
jgi:adenylylsulfate kinase